MLTVKPLYLQCKLLIILSLLTPCYYLKRKYRKLKKQTIFSVKVEAESNVQVLLQDIKQELKTTNRKYKKKFDQLAKAVFGGKKKKKKLYKRVGVPLDVNASSLLHMETLPNLTPLPKTLLP